MQKLTESQGDAVLDLVDACRQVTAAHSSALIIARTATPQAAGRKAIEASTADFKGKVRAVTAAYAWAEKSGVETPILDGVLSRNLPAGVVELLQPTPAA